MHKRINQTKNKTGYEVNVPGNKCYRCEHVWIPRNTENKSRVCPKCKSPYWDKPKNKKKDV